MATPNLGGRKFYHNSGRVNWARFVPMSLLVITASMLLAAGLFLLFKVGLYFVVFVPVIAGVATGGMVMLAVRKGHCRGSLVAGLLAAVAGVTVYLGSFYVGMVYQTGWENATDLAMFPRYIRFRMATDVVRDEHSPAHDSSPDAPSPEGSYFNWARFFFEFGLVLAFPIGMGISQARRPYCEKCQTWMITETTTFKPEIGPAFVEALRINSVQSLAALFTSPPKLGAPNTAVAVNYCLNRKEGRSTDCAVYLSIKQVAVASKGATMDPFKNAKGKLLVNQTSMEQPEIAALLTRFASLEKAAGTTAAKALEDLHVEVKSMQQQVCADIKPVDPLFAGKVLTTKTKLIGSGLVIAILVGCIAFIAMAVVGAMTAFPDHPPVGGVSTLAKVFGEVLIGLGSIGGMWAFVLALTRPDYFATRYVRGVTMHQFARRPHPLVKPDDAGVLFVQIIPRANWGKVKLDDASDIGFLRVDREHGELLFEGDNEYYRIRGEAIVSCDVELFISGEGSHGATKLYRVVLQVNDVSGLREIPIAQRGNVGKYRAKNRAKWARDLQQEIQGLMGASALTPSAL
ncbi:MAG: hypothetical protein JWR26_1687 [Pedosphaera sp.]|nr:hypothetical protein [Pedosphaera sp.]